MRKLTTITLALLVSTPAHAASIILVCKGKSDTIRWDKSSPSGQVIENSGADGQVWKMVIDDAAKTLVFYPLPGLPGDSGRFAGDGDIKSISMEADIERNKDTTWKDFLPYSGSINTTTGQFVITIPVPALGPQSGLQYSGTCKRAQPLF
jgi:hypothetical protein